jgi:hypothetical protein
VYCLLKQFLVRQHKLQDNAYCLSLKSNKLGKEVYWGAS